MQRRRWLSIAFVCLLAISAMSSIDWAPASASRLGQSVPTRTPTPNPTAMMTPLPSPTPQVASRPAASSTPGGAPALLPVAGGDIGSNWLMWITVGLLLLAVWRGGQRRVRSRSAKNKSGSDSRISGGA